eukprot:9467906-Pyramimonas_sp.AAC.2
MGTGGSKESSGSNKKATTDEESRRIYMPVDGSVASERAVRWPSTVSVVTCCDMTPGAFVGGS